MKILWCDTETSGLDPNKNAIIQIACIIDTPKGTREWTSYIKPWPGAVIEDEALAVNGKTREELEAFPDHRAVFAEFLSVLGEHVAKYDPSDKFCFRAYNASFDMSFVHAWARACSEKYLMSFIRWPEQCCAQAISLRHHDRWAALKSRKLAAVAAEFGVQLPENLHDAMADIRLTKELWEKAHA
jgi:DNA polymerase III epsilon subunit-like protein